MVTSPNDTVVTGIGASVTDAQGNVWAIDSNRQVTVNGEVDTTTANVDELAYDNDLVWQKNSDNHWYSKTTPAAAWVYWTNANAPVVIPHVSANDATILAGGNATLVDANGNVWRLTDPNAAKGYQVSVDGAVDPTTDNVVAMAIVNGVIWQENTSALWFSKSTPASNWTNGTTIDPLTGLTEPISLTWIGGGNNLASNPADWSPAIAPAAGDALAMGSGTMNLTGNALAGDTLSVTPNATADINVTGTASLRLSIAQASSGAHVNIDIAAGGTLALTDATGDGYLNISGGTLSFIGTATLPAFTTKLSDSIVGTATIDIVGGNASGSFVEINGSVASGLKFDISAPGPCDAGLQIDHPADYQGTVELQTGYVAFMGITATRGELLNGVLEMFNGTKLVDSTRFVSSPNEGPGGVLQMQQNSDGVMVSIGIGDDYQPGGIGKVLPLTT